MALTALIPLIAGLIGAGGSIVQNNANKKMARDQMAFQERMSSTAAQRSKEDYERAGLNPALAYERNASSPTGASASLEDSIGKGVSSARETAALMQQMKLNRENTQADIELKRGQEEMARQQGNLAWQNTLLGRQQFGFNEIMQPHTARTNAAVAMAAEYDALLKSYQIPGARNTANFENMIGQTKGFLGGAKTLSEILKNFKR